MHNEIAFTVGKQLDHIVRSTKCFCFLFFTILFMQNWSHVSTVIKKLNSKPSKQHGTDQMRIRPWYLFYNIIFCSPHSFLISLFFPWSFLSCIPILAFKNTCTHNTLFICSKSGRFLLVTHKASSQLNFHKNIKIW